MYIVTKTHETLLQIGKKKKVYSVLRADLPFLFAIAIRFCTNSTFNMYD